MPKANTKKTASVRSWRLAALIFGVVLIFSLSPLVLQSTQCLASDATNVYTNDAQLRIEGTVVKLEVAKTESARERGLSGRQCLPADQGMLFVFDEPGEYPFWMKDMRFPIDIVWICQDKKVVAIMSKVPPDTYPNSLSPGRTSQYVIELQAGRSQELGLSPGIQLYF